MSTHDYHMVMKTVGIAELKARLSEYLRAVRRGGTFTVLDRATPIARIVPYVEARPGLAIRPPSPGGLKAVRLPPRLRLETDIVALLMEERQGER